MNLSALRTKRVLVPTVAAAVLLGAGATAWTATADDTVRGDDRDRIAASAVKAAGGGTAVDVETSDDPGEAYEVEVRMDDGSEVDIALDENLDVVTKDVDDDRYDDDRDDSDRDDTDRPDADDRVLTDQEREAAEKAALAAVGGGTVTDVEASDDPGEAYEVEVRDGNKEWDVALDADFDVVSKVADNA
jgi:uncharacterized membrane protein YkoI